MNLKEQTLDAIQNNWKLTESLEKDEIDFVRFSKIPPEIVRPQVVIGNFIDVKAPLGSNADNFLEGTARGIISLQVKAIDLTDDEKTVAEDKMSQMEEEIERILAKETLPSEWDSAYVENRKMLDPEGAPPLLQESLTIHVYYIKTY